MLEWFRCPDSQVTTAKDCLLKCRLDERCLTLPTLTLMSEEREWNGVPSTTQLLNGTMYEFLKLTQPYVVDPDSRAFMLAGTKHHTSLEEIAKTLNLPSEVALNIDRDIFDLLEPENDWYIIDTNTKTILKELGELEQEQIVRAWEFGGNAKAEHRWTLTDYKLWGSYRVARALGLVEMGKKPDPSGAVYKTTTKWGKAGDPKMVTVFQSIPQEADLFNEELQLNRYRAMLEELGITISKMQLQVTVRDGGLAIASGRGVTRNIYKIPIQKLDSQKVKDYFTNKELQLLSCFEESKCDYPCDDRECWEGVKCQRYCEVARYCPKGMLYQQESVNG